MSEWWTYSLSDFLMFSSRSYYRLIALYNEAIWPAHLLALAAGAVVIGCIARPHIRTRRVATLILALAWVWIAWAFHYQRYADINTAGPYFAAAFLLQAVLLGFVGLRSAATAPARPRGLALGVIGLSVFAYPLLALASGASWRQSEVFGIAPDPTVVATLGVLLAWRAHWIAWLIPLAWCAISGATLMQLRVGHAWLLPALAVVAVAAGVWSRRRISSTANSLT